MKPLGQYQFDRTSLSEPQFIARHPTPVLIHRLKGEESGGASFKTSYLPAISKVECIRLTKALPSLGFASATVVDDGSLVVFPVSKRPGAAFPERISVGRTRNMDICLPFANISKHHAYFTLMGSGARYLLTDAGSTNGTFLSGRPLKPEQPVEVLTGALLQFGQSQFLFFTPSSLYGLLSGA